MSDRPERRPLGRPLPGWRPPPWPERRPLAGRWARLEPLGPAHADPLHAVFAADDRIWDYMADGPFDAAGFRTWVAAKAASGDPLFFAILAEGTPQGVTSLMRITPATGCIEIGWIALGPCLQRTTAASEMVFLLADAAFAAGYRRVEWKCDALNAASRLAALRFGFRYEGTFRQHMVVKGRNRDTAWFAITDGDWRGGLREVFAAWLDPANFDAEGRQRSRLGARTAAWSQPDAPAP
jgi:RimJ/RimL family protein N-acetyltransferase